MIVLLQSYFITFIKTAIALASSLRNKLRSFQVAFAKSPCSKSATVEKNLKICLKHLIGYYSVIDMHGSFHKYIVVLLDVNLLYTVRQDYSISANGCFEEPFALAVVMISAFRICSVVIRATFRQCEALG